VTPADFGLIGFGFGFGLVWPDLARSGSVWFVRLVWHVWLAWPAWLGLVCFGFGSLGLPGPVWFGLVWFGLVRPGFVDVLLPYLLKQDFFYASSIFFYSLF